MRESANHCTFFSVNNCKAKVRYKESREIAFDKKALQTMIDRCIDARNVGSNPVQDTKFFFDACRNPPIICLHLSSVSGQFISILDLWGKSFAHLYKTSGVSITSLLTVTSVTSTGSREDVRILPSVPGLLGVPSTSTIGKETFLSFSKPTQRKSSFPSACSWTNVLGKTLPTWEI